MNSNYPIETFYTILIGSAIIQVNFLFEYMMTMTESEEERQMIQEELQNDSSLADFFEFKESIHPDDLSLLNENFDSLSETMPLM